jgi:ABC-type branched-subunit amino acid transport system ATPase component
LLEIVNLHSGYGRKTVLHGIDLRVGKREVVALLGHNGAGKTTLLDTIFGFIPAERGTISYEGRDITSELPHARLAKGIGYVGQGAPVFARMTLHDNLLVGGQGLKDRKLVTRRVEQVLELFPPLAARSSSRAGSLSGGERQMLALGMLLIASPSLLILDEPSGGMSPHMVDKLYEAIGIIIRDLHSSVLLVEQDVDRALDLATRAYVLANGRLKFDGRADSIRNPSARAQILIGL